jgi:hypothetical protein
VEDRSLCCEPQLPGELLLAASLDLQTLDNIGRREPRLLDQAQADMLLVLELKDGSQLIWPQSALRGEPLALAELPKPELGSDDLVYAPPPTFPLLPRCRGFLLLQLSEDFLLDLPPPPPSTPSPLPIQPQQACNMMCQLLGEENRTILYWHFELAKVRENSLL